MNESKTMKFQRSDECYAALITLARKIAGLKQEDVRELAPIGRTQLSMIENGYVLPTKLVHERLIQLYAQHSNDVRYNLSKEINGAWKREMLQEIKKRIGMAEEEIAAGGD